MVLIESAPCVDCGRLFDRERKRGRPRKRCDRCTVSYYSPLGLDVALVGDRDGWVCAICRRAVDKTKSGDHQQGPTVDHIVPRSDSLALMMLPFDVNDPRNLRLAHRACNTKRGTGGEAQLRLIA